MKQAGKPNTLLIEMVIVLLFFSISAVVILQLLVSAHDQSVRSDIGSAATMMAEDMSNRFYVSDLDGAAFFESEGWVREDGQLVTTQVVSGRTLKMSVSGETTRTLAGTFDAWEIEIYDGTRLVIAIPIARYVTGGTAQ